jgi:hypothetical protein
MVLSTLWFRVTATALLTCSMVALSPTTSIAQPPEGDHCITGAGDDLNELFATEDAIVSLLCHEVRTGDHWRPITGAVVAGADYVFPAGYTPTRQDLIEDLLAKLVFWTYVVDPGTSQERAYRFVAADMLFQRSTLPDGSRFIRWVPRLHPLPPGEHAVDMYLTLSADVWDGLDTDPAVNFIPAGESYVGTRAFSVTPRGRA